EKLKGEDTAEIRTATEKVAAVSQKLGQAMYAGAGATGAGARQGSDEEEVVDAEIVDEDEGKRQG
ncbi:molecular chaperone DnaK, partial [Streptomyces nondiastaticus]